MWKIFIAGICVKQAEADADTLIVSTALVVYGGVRKGVSCSYGTDTRLTGLLVARATKSTYR